jgi:adenosylcobinamide-phosphate synthase
MGGANRYGGEMRSKPLLAASSPKPDRSGVERILKLSLTLEITWMLAALPLLLALGAQ